NHQAGVGRGPLVEREFRHLEGEHLVGLIAGPRNLVNGYPGLAERDAGPLLRGALLGRHEYDGDVLRALRGGDGLPVVGVLPPRDDYFLGRQVLGIQAGRGYVGGLHLEPALMIALLDWPRESVDFHVDWQGSLPRESRRTCDVGLSPPAGSRPPPLSV